MWENLHKIPFKFQIVLIFLVTFAVMSLYESVTHLIVQNITSWQIQITTIIFTILLFLIIGYFPIRASYRQHQESTKEYGRRIAAENQLQQSEEKFREIFDMVNDGIHIHELRPDGLPEKFIQVNAVACRMVQYTREELLTKSPLDLTTEYHNRPLSLIGEELKTTGHAIFETEHRRKDGTIVPVEINAHVVIHNGKKVTISVVRDITIRKNTERELQEKEVFQRTLLNNLTAGVIIVDAETFSIELVNPAAAAMFGAPADQIIGRNCHHFLCPADMGACPVTDLAQEVDYSERVMLRSDGTKIPILKSVKKIQVGGRVKLLENFIDITTRKLAEEALLDSENRYRSVVENATEAIVVVQDGKMKYVNPRTLEMLQSTAEEVINQPFVGFIHPDDRTLVVDRYQRRVRGENVPAHYEFRILGKDSLETWVQIAAVLIQWNGKPATLNFLTDITNQKKIQEALVFSNKKLSMLSSVTRHDILNQLMGLRTFLELSKEDTKDPTLLEYIAKEDQAAEAIQWQIEFARSYQELGTQAPQWQNVAERIDAAKRELNLQGVTVDVAVSGIEVFADAPFEKVFFNLMDNSLRHGEHVTRIEFSATETENNLVLFYRDNGVGISLDDKKKLFKKGFGKHIGLGLFLSSEILAVTHITITENGEPGKGVQFEITVPKGTYRFSDAS